MMRSKASLTSSSVATHPARSAPHGQLLAFNCTGPESNVYGPTPMFTGLGYQALIPRRIRPKTHLRADTKRPHSQHHRGHAGGLRVRVLGIRVQGYGF
jgi:hypothetical protein